MAGSAGADESVWDVYGRWNGAIAEVMFPELDTPFPVYLDLEDEQVSLIAAQMGVEPEEVEPGLASAVVGTLQLSGTQVFKYHTSRLWRWSRGDRTETPPVLALLAVLSLTAERMSRGEGFGENNFYGRLKELLGIPQDNENLAQAYRKVAERYWGALNTWLNECDGSRGLPTAFALGHRYVGLPISQALVRKGDRERLVSFFLRFGFSPGSDVPPSELETVLDIWMRQTPCPATKNLERLWQKSDARSRIAQAASVALSAWDGRVEEETQQGGVPRETGRLALGLEISGFPRKRFKLGVLVYAAHPEREREAEILSHEGSVRVALAPAIAGALSLGQSADIDSADLLEGMLRVKDTLTGAQLNRRPKRLNVFRQDQLSMRWLETEQVMLGDDVTLVAHGELESRLKQVLETIARPGWEVITSGYAGLPDGWFVVRNVEVFTHPGDLIKGMDDLGPLVPLTSSQLKLAGGFQLPGATRGKWHSWAPPEIRAVSDTPGGFEVRLLDLTDHAEDESQSRDEAAQRIIRTWADDGQGILVADLTEADLPDGDYRIELVPYGRRDPLTSTHLRLRSGDRPDLMQWHQASQITHYLSQPLGVLGADQLSDDGPRVQGVIVSGPVGQLHQFDVSTAPWWVTEGRPMRRSSGASVRVTLPDPSSCVHTGRHIEEVEYVPVDKWGKPLVRFSVGTCAGCGLVRRYSTSYWKNKRSKERKQLASPSVLSASERRDVSAITRVRPDDTRAWDLVLDGLMHTGGGRWSLLERLAMHIEPTGLFVDQFARALESLGHIEIQRDPTTLQPTEWEITPTAVVRTVNGYLLAGHWPNDITDQATQAVEALGGSQHRELQADGPASWFFDGDRVTVAIQEAELGIAVEEEAWRELAGALPELSTVVEALPRRAAAVDGRIRWFDLQQARWVDAVDLRSPGAYRVTRFATLDVLRTQSDCDREQMATATVQLSKHAAALILKEPPLMAYNRATEELTVPLGADLPGLYGRAAVLCSGLLPVATGRQLVYRNVHSELAGHLAHLLRH